MNIIGILFIGLIAGIIAKLLMPGKDPGGWLVSILLGVGGSFVGGYIGHALNWIEGNEKAGFILSVVGAMVLLAIWRVVSGRKPAEKLR